MAPVQRFLAVVVASCLWVEGARAEESDSTEYRVDFSAGKVELDPELQTLVLQDGVQIRVGRYRLDSEHLVLRRGPRGVEAEGHGTLQLCPCEDAPVELGYSSALIAPPTDLLVRNPTLRVGGVPVLWAPAVWLRAPNRLGVLPPSVSYRGHDGLHLASGVHVPLGADSTVGIKAGGYLKGGVDTRVELDTPRTTTRLRWDHLGESWGQAESTGSLGAGSQGSVTFALDALRGARALRGLVDAEPVARPWDRADVDALVRVAPVDFGVGLTALSPRGVAFDAPVSAGPRASLSLAEALGPSVELGADATLLTLSTPVGDETTLLERVRVLAAPTVGAMATTVTISQGALLSQLEADSNQAVWSSASVRASLPLERRFGESLRHRIEPAVEGAWRAISQRAPASLTPFRDGVVALAGVDTVFGRWTTGEGLRLRARGGYAGEKEAMEPWLAGHAIADFSNSALGLEGSVPVRGRERHHLQALARVGRLDGFHLGGRVATQGLGTAPLGRALSRGVYDNLENPALSQEGVSVGADAAVPWARWLSQGAGAQWDLSEDRRVAVGSTLAYRHPCGCLSALGRVSQRIGRGGFDATLTLDLLP